MSASVARHHHRRTSTASRSMPTCGSGITGAPSVPAPWLLVLAAARADERAQWRFVIASQAEELARYDCTDNPDDVPTYVDVPDDYEAGIHGAARVLRALIERVDQ